MEYNSPEYFTVVQEIGRVVKRKAKLAICFDVGNISELPNTNSLGQISHLPYETCYFEMGFGEGTKVGVLVWERELEEESSKISFPIEGVLFLVQQPTGINIGILAYFMVKIQAEENGPFHLMSRLSVSEMCDFVRAEEMKLTLRGVSWGIVNFLAALQCTNVREVDHKPGEVERKLCASKNKCPPYSFKTLELIVPASKKDKQDPKGGTHASPRLHLRRGHIREYAPGKTCWVQPCMVGDSSKGVVHKEYAAKKSNTETAPHTGLSV